MHAGTGTYTHVYVQAWLTCENVGVLVDRYPRHYVSIPVPHTSEIRAMVCTALPSTDSGTVNAYSQYLAHACAIIHVCIMYHMANFKVNNIQIFLEPRKLSS
jgi:hypothetical protein